MAQPPFDTAGVFDEDYRYFYGPRLDERTDDEVEQVWDLLELESGLAVLDAPCGHGRVSVPLAERACLVTGLDQSELFLAEARRAATGRGVVVELVRGDLRRLPFDRRFDRALNWFTSFGYFDDGGNRQVLRELRRVLRDGGRLLLEIVSYEVLVRSLQPWVVVERGDDLLIDHSTLEVQEGRIITRRTIVRDGRVRHTHFFVRTPTFPELRAWLLDAGFSTVEAWDEQGRPFGVESRRLIAVAHC